jgi:glycosyltransferase involved in cell wall biosynthesis
MKLLVASRSRFTVNNRKYYFQINDGFYLNEIAGCFNEVIIYAGEVRRHEVHNETLLLSSNIACVNRAKLNINKFFFLLKHIIKADIVYSFYPQRFSLMVSAISWFLGKKVISYNGGCWSEMYLVNKGNSRLNRFFSNYYVLLEYLSLVFAKAYITNVNTLYLKYHDRFNMSKSIPLLRFAVDDIYYRDNTCDKHIVNLICVSHVKPGKDILEIIQALTLLNQGSSTNNVFKLTIVGRFDLSEKRASWINEYVRKNKIKNVDFVGIINDKDKLMGYYRQSDILILASKSEGFPRVLWEAFSQSLPVICTKLQNIVLEFDSNRKPVHYIETNTPETIKQAVDLITNNSKYNASLIKAGLTCFKNKFQQTNLCQLKKILDNL